MISSNEKFLWSDTDDAYDLHQCHKISDEEAVVEHGYMLTAYISYMVTI